MFELSKKQKKSIKMVFSNKISILIGGAGTGKTTVIKNIIDKAEDLNLIVRQAAPTGKAAKRMMEASRRPASTIHALLGVSFGDDGFFKFICNEENPIRADLIIIDEVSMIDNNLMYHLVKAVNVEKTTVLLVGDSGQLPSVGAGAILRDLVSSNKIPYVELDFIHRNSGKIVEACSSVRNGNVFMKNHPKTLDLDAENPVNMVHLDCDTPEKTLKAVGYLVERMGVRGFDMVNDVQVISPYNKKGLLSCESINTLLKNQLNPQKYPEKEGEKFRIGDKVINTKNQTMEDVENEPVLIVNGDIGFVTDIHGKQITVKFADPERVIQLPANSNKLLKAYCITCHRFQGSQAPVIIVPLDKSFKYTCNKKWLYTALSRATTLCITCGDFQAIQGIINNHSSNIERVTMLRRILIERFNEFAGELGVDDGFSDSELILDNFDINLYDDLGDI